MSVYIYILHILYTLQESVTYKIFTNPVSSSRCVVLILVNRRLDIIGSYIVFNSAEEYMACTGRTTMHGLKFSLPLLLFVPGSVRMDRYTHTAIYASFETSVGLLNSNPSPFKGATLTPLSFYKAICSVYLLHMY